MNPPKNWPLILCSVLILGCTRTSERVYSGRLMGVAYEICVLAEGKTEEIEKSIAATFSAAESTLSLANPGSELSLFNQSDKLVWIPASRALVTVADEALRTAKLTDGAWDPTAGKLAEIYREAGLKPPHPQALAAAKSKVGYFHLEARQEPLALKKSRRGMDVDFSALTLAYAADELAADFRRKGVENFQIRVGSSTRASGHNAREEIWPFHYLKPGVARQSPLHLTSEVVALENRAAAVFELPTDVTLVDPRTAKPLATDLLSVTVLDVSALRAQALALGLFAVGKTAAVELARKEGVAASFVSQQGEQGLAEATPLFPAPLRSTF